MPQDHRQYEYGRAQQKVNDDLEVPKNKVATPACVEPAQCRNGAPAERQVSGVSMPKTQGPWSKVEGRSCKDTVYPVEDQTGIME